MESGYFKTFDGTKLYYQMEGEGEPLLFIYGLACSELHWRYQVDYFKKGYRTIWFDYRGHHRSDIPEDPELLTITNIARDVESLLDELKIPKAVLLGHSMGTNIVLETYRRCPNRVKAMVLANGSVRSPLESLLHSNVFQLVFPYIYELYKKYPALANRIWKANGNNKITPWVIGQLGFNPNYAKASDIEDYVRMVSNMDMIVTLQLLKDYEKYDATPWLHRIDVPTLIIAGENDLVVPREAQELMNQLIPNSRLEVVRNGSHCPQMDIPELVNIMIERFLKETSPMKVVSEAPSVQAAPQMPAEPTPAIARDEAPVPAPVAATRGDGNGLAKKKKKKKGAQSSSGKSAKSGVRSASASADDAEEDETGVSTSSAVISRQGEPS